DIINDYKRWIEYLKNLNEFDAAVREQELKQAFDTEKNKCNKKIKELEEENTSLKNQLSANQNKIVKLENEVTRLTDNLIKWNLSTIIK
ncbi:39324_t:CDS:2, partial [Gigaspora margarita]